MSTPWTSQAARSGRLRRLGALAAVCAASCSLLAGGVPASADPYGTHHGTAAIAANPNGTSISNVIGLKGRPHTQGAIVGPVDNTTGTRYANLRPMQGVATTSISGVAEWNAAGWGEGCLRGPGPYNAAPPPPVCSGTFTNGQYAPLDRVYVDYLRCTSTTNCYYGVGWFGAVSLGTDPWIEVHRYASLNGCGTGLCWEALYNGGFLARWDSTTTLAFNSDGSENASGNLAVPADMTEQDYTALQVTRPGDSGFIYWPNAVGQSPHAPACYVTVPYPGNFTEIRDVGSC
jgi:hypothetical protein